MIPATNPGRDINMRIKNASFNPRYILRAVRMVFVSAPGTTVLAFVLMGIQSMLPLLALHFMKQIVEYAQRAALAGGSGALLLSKEALWAVFGAACTGIFIAIVKSIADIVREKQGSLLGEYVQDLVHRKSIAVDASFYERPDAQDSLYRAQQDSGMRPVRIVNALFSIMQGILSFAGIALFMSQYHWLIVVVLMVSVLPGVGLKIRYSNSLYRWNRVRTRTERETQYLHRVLTFKEYAKDVRLLGIGDFLANRFIELSSRVRQERLSLSIRRGALETAIQVLGVVALFGTLAYAVVETAKGVMSVGDLVVFQQAFQRSQSNLQEVMRGISSLYEDSLFLSGLFEFIDMPLETVEGDSAPQLESAPVRIMQGVELSDVVYRYPGSGHEAIRHVDLRIPAGKIVALVGENGSGKTTLVKLLSGLYRPASGSIRIDGIDVECIGRASLWRMMSVVMQDFSRYETTARQNVWFGDIQSDPQAEALLRAVEESGASGFLSRYPDGLDTHLGNLFHDGREISGGEWQKIVLARAFYRDAPFIILDEPTSALDARAECEMFESFRKLLRGRTALLVSHRFSTVRMADYIYVLDSGTVAEQGTHDSLMEEGGLYSRLYSMQASSYV